jgi:lambda family phage minor tail protein L
LTYNRDLQIATQKLSGESIVSLYTVDATELGAGIYKVTNFTDDGSPIVFGGITFTPIPLQTEGWEITSEGSMPRPTMRVSTKSPVFASFVREYDNGVGAVVYRQRTYARFLDGHEDANPNAQFSIDVYRINEKTDEYGGILEWELTSYFDLEGKKIPGRQILRDTCTHIYRRWNGTDFDYSKATCPYAGENFWKPDGTPTSNAAEDRCGKKLSDCKLRFGENQPLYTRAFPGVGRTSQYD